MHDDVLEEHVVDAGRIDRDVDAPLQLFLQAEQAGRALQVVFNANGALTARAVVSQRVNPGMMMMYHAQEKIINTPGSEMTGNRGGIHNSVTRTVLKPTHMIGGYAQLAYGFNYYGTVGANRDEYVIIRKMSKVDWLEDELPAAHARELAE